MRFSIESREGYLYAALYGRDNAEQMREFLQALAAACREHNTPRILVSMRQSRAMFKPEDYGFGGAMQGYAKDLVTPACQVAVIGDTQEVHAANEYIEMVAREQGVNMRAFRDEEAALRWLREAGTPGRRYRFTRIVIAGAPDAAGVYALWEGEELVYYGRADGAQATIRARLLDHYYEDAHKATHYSWEVCEDPGTREAELLAEHERAHGRPPRNNGKAA
jgi:hypothetical protein